MAKKGQITMESLLLYGLAILVVLLAVGALTYFGVLDLGKFLPDRCNLASSGTVSCEAASYSTTSKVLTMGVKNVGTKPITGVTLALHDSSSGINCGAGAVVATIQPGDTQPVSTAACTGSPLPVAGKKLRGSLTLSYTLATVPVNSGGSIVTTATG